MERGVFIDIEGIDGSVKTTQAELLSLALRRRGQRVKAIKFPRYRASVFGAFVADCLAGVHGDFLKLDPHFAAVAYLCDQAAAAPEILEALEGGESVVADRYAPSNLAHQAAKLAPDGRSAFISFLERGLHEELRAPRPDIVVCLDMPVGIAVSLLERKGARAHLGNRAIRDAHEADEPYLAEVRQVYRTLAAERHEWYTIECSKGLAPLAPELVHGRIMQAYESFQAARSLEAP